MYLCGLQLQYIPQNSQKGSMRIIRKTHIMKLKANFIHPVQFLLAKLHNAPNIEGYVTQGHCNWYITHKAETILLWKSTFKLLNALFKQWGVAQALTTVWGLRIMSFKIKMFCDMRIESCSHQLLRCLHESPRTGPGPSST